MGGQTALNLCKEGDELGIWEKYNVRLIGVDIKAIDKAEDREKFRQWMIEMDIPVAPAKTANSFLEGKEFAQEIGFPFGNSSFIYIGRNRWKFCTYKR